MNLEFNQAPGVRPAPAFPAAAQPAAEQAPKKSSGIKGLFARGDKAPKATRRSYKIQIGAAIGFGLIAALLVLTGGEATTTDETYVARTTRPLAAQAVLVAGDLEVVALDAAAIEADAISGEAADVEAAVEALVGRRTASKLSAGEQVHLDDAAVEANLAIELAADERIVSLRARVGDAAGGVLSAGDHVDVLATGSAQFGTRVTAVVVDDVEIVAVRPSESSYNTAASAQNNDTGRDLAPEALLPGDPVPGIYLVRVTADEALRIAAVNVDAQVSLAYRVPGIDAEVTDEAGLEAVTSVTSTEIFDASVAAQATGTMPFGS
ncbi:MAG: hypothetical protein GY882_07350 [Actinomycetia bacterium]|nr:hypothetical protein [Actinomycetes bacterium]